MDILNFIQKKVNACTYKQLKDLSDQTGVPYGTLMKIKSGQTDNPRIRTVQPLFDHFNAASTCNERHSSAKDRQVA